MERWKLKDRIEKIVNGNCVEYPYEGTEVNKSQIVEDVLDLIDELEKHSERLDKIFQDPGNYL